jgi:hypothetical protein
MALALAAALTGVDLRKGRRRRPSVLTAEGRIRRTPPRSTGTTSAAGVAGRAIPANRPPK